MVFETKRPKPVLIPYVCSPAAGSRDPLDELAGGPQLLSPLLGEPGIDAVDGHRPDVRQRQIVTRERHCGRERHRGKSSERVGQITW